MSPGGLWSYKFRGRQFPGLFPRFQCGRYSVWVAQIFENLVGRKYLLRQNSEFNRARLSLTIFKREFDPGSESTLAARLTHASRTRKQEQSCE